MRLNLTEKTPFAQWFHRSVLERAPSNSNARIEQAHLILVRCRLIRCVTPSIDDVSLFTFLVR